MKVLQIIPQLKYGGAERMVVHLARELVACGCEVHLARWYPASEHPFEKELRDAGVVLHEVRKTRGPSPSLFLRVRALLRGIAPDVVHTHLGGIRYAAPAIIASGVASVHTLHSLAQNETDPLGRIWNLLAFRMGIGPVAIASAVGQSIEHVYGVPPVAQIANGIALKRAKISREEARRLLGVDSNEFVVVCVARLNAAKNHAGLLRAIAKARRRIGRLRLLLAGDGELRHDLERACAGLGLSSCVAFLGDTRDVENVYAAGDVSVLFSDWEGSPLSVMEAMSWGLPVVATSVGGVPELVEDRSSGLLVGVGDEDGLANAIGYLAENPAIRAAFGARGASRSQERFGVDLMARSYASLYANLIGARR